VKQMLNDFFPYWGEEAEIPEMYQRDYYQRTCVCGSKIDLSEKVRRLVEEGSIIIHCYRCGRELDPIKIRESY
jgi:hypothetical protein